MKTISKSVCPSMDGSLQKKSSSQMTEEGFDVKPPVCQQEERDSVGDDKMTMESQGRFAEINQQLLKTICEKERLINEQNETVLQLKTEMQRIQSSHELTEISLNDKLSDIDFQLKIAHSDNQKLKEDNKALHNAISQRKVDAVNAENSRNTIDELNIKCGKCHEEDVLKEKLQSLREMMEKVQIESMYRATNLANLQNTIKIVHAKMCTFKKLSRKSVSCAKQTRTFAKKYSRKSTYHSVKAFYAVKSASSAKATYYYVKKCNTLRKTIALVVRNPVRVSVNGQRQQDSGESGQDEQSSGNSSRKNSSGISTNTISSHDAAEETERSEIKQPASENTDSSAGTSV